MEMRPTRRWSQPRERNWLVTTCLIALFCYVLLPLGPDAPPRPIAAAAANALTPSQPAATKAAKTPLAPPPLAPPNILTFRSVVKKGQSAAAIFYKMGIKSTQVMAMYHAVREVYDLQRLNVGQPYRIQFSPDGQLHAFTYDIDMQHRLEVRRQGKTFVGRIELIPYERSERVMPVGLRTRSTPPSPPKANRPD